MELFAYIGDEEHADRPQRVGIKQGLTAAGMIPLAVMDFDLAKLENDTLVKQMQAMSNMTGVTYRLARFTFVEDVMVIKPTPKQ